MERARRSNKSRSAVLSYSHLCVCALQHHASLSLTCSQLAFLRIFVMSHLIIPVRPKSYLSWPFLDASAAEEAKLVMLPCPCVVFSV